MIDIGNDNLDNELNIQKNNKLNEHIKSIIFKNGELIDLRTEEEIKYENRIFMNSGNNPKELEYWRNIFPNKTDNELKEYIDRWGKENPKYLKFNRL